MDLNFVPQTIRVFDETKVTKPLEDDYNKKVMMEEINKLNERDREIIIMRYGLFNKEEKTQKEVADYLLDNDLHKTVFVAFFEENSFCPMEEDDNQNWCGGINNAMFALDNNGLIYHCIRFMETSLQGEQEPLPIGDCEHGIGVLPRHAENIANMCNITRRSQSTDECFYCPIAKGCAWCSGYNYQVTGDVNKRVTYICETHKARALANVYFWNKLYKKMNVDKIMNISHQLLKV